MNYVKKLNLHWFCTQNHILEPFSVRRACTKSYVTSELYPRASQIWCQNVWETWKKKVIKCRSESFARCRVIARNVEGGGPSLFRVKYLKITWTWPVLVLKPVLDGVVSRYSIHILGRTSQIHQFFINSIHHRVQYLHFGTCAWPSSQP